MNFRILVYFKKLTKPFKGGWPCIYGFGYYFRVHWGCMKQRSVWWRFCALQKWQKRFVCSTKNFYYECRRSVYLAASKTLAVNNVPIWTTLMACSPYADHWGNIHHILHIWRNQGELQYSTGSPMVSSRGLIPHKKICTINIWGGGEVFAPPPSYKRR